MSLHGDELYRQLDSDGDGLPDIDSSVDGFGQSLANVGDLDGDGVAELLVGATGAWGWDPDWTLQGNWPDWYDGVGLGMARLVSLGTGLTIKQYFNDGGSSGDNYGFAVAGGGDFDGDGLPDFVISAAWEGPGNFGGVRTYSSDLRFGLVYGSGLPTSTGLAASLEATGQLSAAAGQLVMLGSNLPPNEMGLLIASTEQGPGQPVGDGLMFLAPGVGGIHRLGVFSSDANGDVRIELDLDALPFEAQPLPLDRWNYQLWFRDSTPGGFNFSDALTVGFY